MARKVRIEYGGARYHVFNRGNYKAPLFEDEGAQRSFRATLSEACVAMDWRLHAWCLMRNHFHLCLETPSPNLVEGMRWLQSTFANRFNHFHRAHGHVFQGRYRSILLEEEATGPVCHYIHLNPVRAGVIEAGSLERFAESSFASLWYPRRRKPFEVVTTGLAHAGGLPDTAGGHRAYRDYLARLAGDNAEQERLGFDTMGRGWMRGSEEFRDEVLAEHFLPDARTVVETEAAGMREPRWERHLAEGLQVLGRRDGDLVTARKGESWKVDLARFLRESTLAPYRWIAARLHMGTPSYVQGRVSLQRKAEPSADWRKLAGIGKGD